MKHNTSNLSGALLDAAVAKADGYASAADVPESICGSDSTGGIEPWMPSSSWEQGGPIIEREGISLDWQPSDHEGDDTWTAWHPSREKMGGHWPQGPTPLIAAMRAYVASKLGEEVELP